MTWTSRGLPKGERPVRVRVDRVPSDRPLCLCCSTFRRVSGVVHKASTPPATLGEETVISVLLRLAALSETTLLCARGYRHPATTLTPTHVQTSPGTTWEVHTRANKTSHVCRKMKSGAKVYDPHLINRLCLLRLFQRAWLHNIPEDS